MRCLLPLFGLSGWLLLAWFSHHSPPGLLWWLLAVLALEWTLTLLVWRLSAAERSGWRWIAWGVSFRLIGLFALPLLEDDHFRFLWDGRMFALTGNPYGATPSEHFSDASLTGAFAEILDQINYPHVPTIYGPVFQLGFLLSYLISPAALWPWKLLLIMADVAFVIMLRYLGKGETGQRAALFAAWCPLSVFETAFNAHPDAIAVTLLTAAMLSGQSGRHRWLGFCCGTAIAAKLFALLIVPFLLWRRRWPAWAGAVVVALAWYAPFWLQGSSADFAGLRAFARDWEFNSSGYALLAWGLGPDLAQPAGAVLFAIGWIILFVYWTRRDSHLDAPPPGLAVFGLFFLFAPTFNPWYALWLLPFVALRPTFTGVAILGALSLSYVTRQNLGEPTLDGFAHPAWVRPLEFGLIALAAVVELYRWRLHRRFG